MNELHVKKMEPTYAEEILSWKYEPPYDFYNNELNDESLSELLNNEYKAIVNNQNEVIGFFCVGNSAQVPVGHQFGAYASPFPDIGLGMKPTLTGKGNGTNFFSFVLEQIQKEHGLPIRLTVAKFNQRAIRLYEKFGFAKKIEFKSKTTEFITMIKDH
ncbi:GNAT family N-acetyltransferase [Ureibacillus acetophenoni]|uniref:RimJ/RimL family protein N-acetyltransferase n=1 Tax=Ureibacillus acetophenoni TaxID=614649 RepID=A0A285UHT8_9BACL|nr:GNAT family protein [Ureibacillus acetophenoni]SOC39811.1 RimJ/RimL family protein N-acetyltransferase [Ureibacillus acetophenoni]